jgi:hypothetical protein
MQSVTNEKSALIGAIVDRSEGNTARTENGALTNASSLNKVLDLFFQAGAMRSRPDSDIEAMVDAAATQDLALTIKLIFWARDVTRGAGERRFFKVALSRLVQNYPDELAHIVRYVPEYGRWDDLFVLLDTPLEAAALEALKGAFEAGNALMVKWLPQRGPVVNKLSKLLGYAGNPKAFRKRRVDINKVIESALCEKRFGDINYSHVPSKAMKKYRKAFAKRDGDRFKEYLSALASGDKAVKVNAKAIFPYEILKAVMTETDQTQLTVLNEQWKALPDFLAGNNQYVLPVCDVSGSMGSLAGSLNMKQDNNGPAPILISVSLGLYTAERNVGPFKDAFITFSAKPALQLITGQTLKERATNLSRANWDMNTDLGAVFELILSKARAAGVAAGDMPGVILIISDMEFDAACGNRTPFEKIKADYARYDYAMPKVVFWNVAARNEGNFPVIDTTPNTALVSGFSPSILKPVLKGEIPRPDMVMLEVLNSERYAPLALK